MNDQFWRVVPTSNSGRQSPGNSGGHSQSGNMKNHKRNHKKDDLNQQSKPAVHKACSPQSRQSTKPAVHSE